MDRLHPDIFTAEQAATYLQCEVATLAQYRDQKMLVGYRHGKQGYCYWREDLDDCAMRVFGRTPPMRQPKLAPMRMAK